MGNRTDLAFTEADLEALPVGTRICGPFERLWVKSPADATIWSDHWRCLDREEGAWLSETIVASGELPVTIVRD